MHYSAHVHCRRVCHADKQVLSRKYRKSERFRRVAGGPYRKRLTVTPCKLPNATSLTDPSARCPPAIDLDAKLPIGDASFVS